MDGHGRCPIHTATDAHRSRATPPRPAPLPLRLAADEDALVSTLQTEGDCGGTRLLRRGERHASPAASSDCHPPPRQAPCSAEPHAPLSPTARCLPPHLRSCRLSEEATAAPCSGSASTGHGAVCSAAARSRRASHSHVAVEWYAGVVNQWFLLPQVIGGNAI